MRQKKSETGADAVAKLQRTSSSKFDIWTESPETVKQFLELRPAFAQLSSEIAYTLTLAVDKAGISVAAITHRAKDLNSFLEKIERKTYDAPFDEITDLAGVRIVCYYPDDLPKLAKLVENLFEQVDRDDKTASSGVDRFGYGGIHYLVKLGKRDSGARYDDLKDKICEIQIRTVMQDAWAVLSHHLIYKKENDAPPTIRRSVNALAGAMDTADIAFQAIRDERDRYQDELSETLKRTDLSKIGVNADTVIAYLKDRFPQFVQDEEHARGKGSGLLNKLINAGYTDLGKINELLTASEAHREWVANNDFTKDRSRSAWNELLRGFYILHPDVDRGNVPKKYSDLYNLAAAELSLPSPAGD